MRNPAVRVLLEIFIGQHGLKGASMQVQIQHISRTEGVWGDCGEKLLIHHPVASFPDGR
jgi:hypothetical protein